MPIHLLIHHLRRAALAALFAPLLAFAQEKGLPDGLYAQFATPRGDFTCELAYARTPLTVVNFVGLAEGTLGPAPRKPFFNGLTFHRVVPHFVIQGGDPLGTGQGGPGYTFADEFVAGLTNDVVGALSMANEGPDTNGSQFFLTLEPVGRLDFLHTVFGRTVRGADVLAKVLPGDAMTVRILRIGQAARDFKADDSAFAALAARVARYTGEKEPGPKAHFDDADKVLPTDPPRAQYFNYKLANVERATGLRILGRVFARFAAAPGAETPEAGAARLAASLDAADRAVVAVYFAEQDAWCLHIPTLVSARFTTRESAARAAPAAILMRARMRAARYADQTRLAMPAFDKIAGQKAKISTDAVLDELIATFAAAP